MVDKTKMVFSEMKKAGKPVRPGDIVKMTGLGKDEVSKILNELKPPFPLKIFGIFTGTGLPGRNLLGSFPSLKDFNILSVCLSVFNAELTIYLASLNSLSPAIKDVNCNLSHAISVGFLIRKIMT